MPENNTSTLFRSSEETTKPEVSQINGTIPSWMNGTFLRTGPGKWDFDDNFTMNHWFDGFALLSKFYINGSNQTITFEKKFLKSDAYTKACLVQKPVITEFGTKAYPDPNKSFFSRILSSILPIELSDNDCINVFQLGSEIFATSETCYFHQINPNCLSTGKEKYDVNKYFGTNIASAHPLTDSETGITYNIGCTVLTGLKYNIIKIPPAASNQCAKDLLKKSKILTTISSSYSAGLLSYNHSFAMTKNYIVFIEQPFVMNIAKAAKTYLAGNPVFKDFVEWRSELKNRFYIIEKESGNVLKTEYISKENFFFLHIINAYEEDGQIVVDLISYKNADFFDATYLSSLREGNIHNEAFQSTANRFVLPIISNSEEFKVLPEKANLIQLKTDAQACRIEKSIILTPEILTESGLENPAVSKKYLNRKYNHFYTCGVYGKHAFSNSIVKYDLRKKECILWKGTNEQFPGEPMFIQNPNTTNTTTEDGDGVLVSIISENNSNKNGFILFLDSKSMQEIGRAYFQNHVPIALHGIYLPSITAN